MGEKELKKFQADIEEGEKRSIEMVSDMEKERSLVEELKVSIGDKALAGGNREELSTELAHAERRFLALEVMCNTAQNRLKDKKKELEKLLHADAVKRHDLLTKQAQELESELCRHYYEVWKDNVKLLKICHVEQADFAKFGLPMSFYVEHWGNEVVRLENYISALEGMFLADVFGASGVPDASGRLKEREELLK